MTSIESSRHPLVFPVANLADSWRPSGYSREFPLAFRTCARALAGMQKEAVVSPAVGPAWRMVCALAMASGRLARKIAIKSVGLNVLMLM